MLMQVNDSLVLCNVYRLHHIFLELFLVIFELLMVLLLQVLLLRMGLGLEYAVQLLTFFSVTI